MPKDAKGHGSNPRGITSVRYKVKDPTWTGTVITHGAKPVASGGQPKSSNAEAASKLASGPKSTAAPVHEAMQGVGPNDPRAGSRDYDSFGRPRSADSLREYDEGTRDMALRSRNGQIGSGMKFRG